MHCFQVITDPGCSMLTFTLRWLRWPGNSTVLIGLGAGDAIWWWILKRSRQLLQSKVIPLGYMLSKMHLIMPLSLSVCVCLSLIHSLCVHLLNIVFWVHLIYLTPPVSTSGPLKWYTALCHLSVSIFICTVEIAIKYYLNKDSTRFCTYYCRFWLMKLKWWMLLYINYELECVLYWIYFFWQSSVLITPCITVAVHVWIYIYF